MASPTHIRAVCTGASVGCAPASIRASGDPTCRLPARGIGPAALTARCRARHYADSPSSGPLGWGVRAIMTLLIPE